MKLADLNPRIESGILIFNCPCSDPDCEMYIRVPIVEERKNRHGCFWQCIGEMPDVTLKPSIKIDGHWHGNVTAGVVITDLS